MPPNVMYVQRYLREHNIDAMLAEAVNRAVERRDKDPAASLANFFSKYSRRNGEIMNVTARTVMDLDLEPILEVIVECFENGGTKVASTSVGFVEFSAPVPAEGDAEVADAEQPSRQDTMKMLAERINADSRAALLGKNVRSVRENDEALRDISESVPPGLLSLALVDAAAKMGEKPLWLHLAETVAIMAKEHPDHIGGGVEVTRGLSDDGAGNAEQVVEETGEQNDERDAAGAQPTPRPGVGVMLPVPIFPGIAAGDRLEEKCAVRFRTLYLVGRRDAPPRETVANLIAVYTKLVAELAEKNDGAPVQVLADG